MGSATQTPVVALTLGDPAGIGPELIAKLAAQGDLMGNANVVIVGDQWLWSEGQRAAGIRVATTPVGSFAEVRARTGQSAPAFLTTTTIGAQQVETGAASAAGGASTLAVLDLCLDAATARHIDGICFAPLNKHAMKLGGLKHEDELHYFADRLAVQTYTCEFNVLGGLWTSRISSHVPLRDVSKYVTAERVIDAATLIYRALQASGVEQPRVAVAGLNPHNGEGGTCGREEIDIIAPAVATLNARGVAVTGPFAADTLFIKARDGAFDAVVTMYHDQGQIALKLLGFSKGVTVQGGLPIPITTPAHGTAYDIAGKGQATVTATEAAFRIAVRMSQDALRAAA